MNKIFEDARKRMGKSVESFKSDISRVRTGRAHPSLLEHLMVDYYGTSTPITQTASVSLEDSRTLLITVWDAGAVKLIEKSILNSDLGLNPNTAGTVIRVPVPPLTEERRQALVKILKNEVAVRNIRRDSLSKLKDLKKNKEISEDDERSGDVETQKITDEHVKLIDEIVTQKEKEIVEI